MGDTKIEWTERTWNPTTGCSKVSQGCKHCYAERVFPRVYGQTRKFTDVRTHPDRLDQPLRWRKPRRVFVNSMSDLFHGDVPDEFIDKVFAVMALAPRHSFQVLTKRPQRMAEYFRVEDRQDYISSEATLIVGSPCATGWLEDRDWPFPNVWLGVSCEDQATADERIPLLLQTPAAIRFVSYEPALAPVNFHDHWVERSEPILDHGFYPIPENPRINWIIAGGESGPNARPAHPDWFRSVRDQCASAGTAFFFKQWGEWRPTSHGPCANLRPLQNKDFHWWDRQGSEVSHRVGKKAAGRLLDGREHSEYPA